MRSLLLFIIIITLSTSCGSGYNALKNAGEKVQKSVSFSAPSVNDNNSNSNNGNLNSSNGVVNGSESSAGEEDAPVLRFSWDSKMLF